MRTRLKEFHEPDVDCRDADNCRWAKLCAGPTDSCDQADVQNVFKIISEDKAKTKTFCQIGKLGDEMEQANAKRDSKKVEELALKADELGKQLGSEYSALMDGIENVDPESEVGLEIRSTIQALDTRCTQ